MAIIRPGDDNMGNNDLLQGRLTSLQSKIEILKYKQKENDEKKKAILKELEYAGIKDADQLKLAIEAEEKSIGELEVKFGESLTKVESMVKDLEDKVAGKVTTGVTL